MSKFEKIRRFYRMGIYSDRHIAAFLMCGAITAEQYAEIIREA